MGRREWFEIAVAAGALTVSGFFGGPIVGLVFAAITVYALIRWYRLKGAQAINWKEIEGRFKELLQGEFNRARAGDKSDGPLEADQVRTSGQDWSIRGGSDVQRRRANTLCALAGRSLKASKLDRSERLRRITDHTDRWLWFLVEIGEAPMEFRRRIQIRDTQTDELTEQYSYHISSLSESSVRACEACIAKSVNTTP